MALFPKSLNFDYRQLFDDKNDTTLDNYMNNELMGFVNEITKSDRGVNSRKISKLYAHSRKMKCVHTCQPIFLFVQDNLLNFAGFI